MGKERVGDDARIIVRTNEIQSTAVDAVVVFKNATFYIDRAAVEAQSTADGSFTNIASECHIGKSNVAVDETQASAIHKVNGINFAIQYIVVHVAVVH